MFNSKEYWESRYEINGNSDIGSYNKLAEFKATCINEFVNANNIVSMIDYGVGDGNQLSMINTQNKIYTGIDVSPTIINKCKKMFETDNTKTFLLESEINNNKADLVLSCDVIYHLIEQNVYECYMETLFEMSNKYVIIYAKNEDTTHTRHVKFRKFTNYIDTHCHNWKLIGHIPNKYPQLSIETNNVNTTPCIETNNENTSPCIETNNENTSPSDFYIFENFGEQSMNKIPIYISLTSIFQNQNILFMTLQSIMIQTTLPDKIFLYLSENPYILDSGFANKVITNQQLLDFLEQNKEIIKINWVENQGSYRKLLPLLKEKWDEDCIIITIDDDTVYDYKLVTRMVQDYFKHNCVINYRGFTPKMNHLGEFDYLERNKLINNHIYNFPTGKGGILYKPQFFHKTDNLIFTESIYMNICDKQDDIWFYIIRIKNGVLCYLDDIQYQTRDLTVNGLYKQFNSIDNNNTKVFHAVLKQLSQI